MRAGGVVLCGGSSRRMGRPKAWLPFGDEVLLTRVVRLLSEAMEPVVVVAAAGQELPPLPPAVAVVRDEEPGRGPLQGLATGLKALPGQVEAAYLSSCDVPLLRPAFVRRLIDLVGEAQICVPQVGPYHHPLAAVYRLDVLAAAERLLSEGRRRLLDLLEAVPTRVVGPAELADVDPTFQSLRNLNTPEDYQAALHDAGTS